MRIVLDTNTVVSGALWGAKPGATTRSGPHQTRHLVTSLDLLAELAGKSYDVEHGPDLTIWSVFTNVTATGIAMTVRDAGALAGPQQFYRARLRP